MSPRPRRASHALLFALALSISTTATSTADVSTDSRSGQTPNAGQMWDQMEQTVRKLRRSWSWLEAIVADLDELSARLVKLSVVPVDAPTSSEFGYRRDPINRRRRLHKGIDFDAERGTPVRAAGYGRVVRAARSRGYGRLVVIDHGLGLETRYAHLRRIEVSKGDLVQAGALVGKVGQSGRATGPHLHFEVRRDGDAVDPRGELTIPDVEEAPRERKRPRKRRRHRQLPSERPNS